MKSLALSVALCIPITTLAGHGRLSLDQKVRASDLIVVGTVTSIDDAPRFRPSHDPAENAGRVATVSVERVLKGSDEATIEIGFAFSYQNNEEGIVVGDRYLLFLRELDRPYFGLVNLEYGVNHVHREFVENPNWPSKDTIRRYEHNRKHGENTSEAPLAGKWMVTLDEAVVQVEATVAKAERRIELGKIYIDGDLATVLYEPGKEEQRILVRYPRYNACPELDLSRVTCELRDESASYQALEAPSVGPAPESVDYLRTTNQISISFPPVTADKTIVSVTIKVDQTETKLCLPGELPVRCHNRSVVPRCAACRSYTTLPIRYGLMQFPSDPCRSARFRAQVHGGCVVRSEEWVCRACGHSWGGMRAASSRPRDPWFDRPIPLRLNEDSRNP